METTAIGALFNSVTSVITNIMTLFTTVSTALMKNPLFQITVGVVILFIIIGLVFLMIKKLKKRGK